MMMLSYSIETIFWLLNYALAMEIGERTMRSKEMPRASRGRNRSTERSLSRFGISPSFTKKIDAIVNMWFTS